MFGQLRHLQVFLQMFLQVCQYGMQTGIVGNGQGFQQEAHVLADGRKQTEKAQGKSIQIGSILPVYLRPFRSDKLQVFCHKRVGVVYGKILQRFITSIAVERQIKDYQRSLPVVTAQFVFRTTGNPCYVLLRHKIVGRTNLYMQCARKGIYNLALAVRMTRQIYLFPTRLLDSDGLPTGTVYQRNVTLLFLIHC